MSKTHFPAREPFSARGVEAPTLVFESNADASKYAARQIANLIRERNAFGKSAALGLVAGSSPMGVYQELVRFYEEEGLNLSNVHIFMVNEYYGVDSDRLQSLRRWLLENFVSKTNVQLKNVHCFDANVSSEDLETSCLQYEREIAQAGGLDFLLLGVAVNGAVGFNEPYTSKKSRTRLATLDHQTRLDAASLFFSESNVPTHGLTIGFGTMLEAKKIVVLAFGDKKASVIQRALEDPISDDIPAGWLRTHDDVSFIVDKNAASALKDVATPWRVRRVEWNDSLVKRAALWLCEQSGKSLLKLTDSDFRAHGLHSLLRDVGPASVVSERVFTQMMGTIALHPCGSEKRRVLTFSPHPDDDVISMGGTMIRLVDDGHELHVAYMTSGNIAVNDYDARRIGDLLVEINREYGLGDKRSKTEGSADFGNFVESKIISPLLQKKPGDVDSRESLDLKRLIRWSEARAA
ncbi:MAG: 6-phosphogluconolactonase, partial [Thermoguttaceae bacterium]|nr:6-phosphogluconolactonase [Thermoguttaceae bacterium]